MDIETNPNLPPVISKLYTLPLKHQEYMRKRSRKDLKKSGVI